MFIFFPRLSSFLKPMTFFFATKLKSIFILIIASIMLIIPVFAYVISFTSTYKCGFASYSKNFLSFRSTICSFAIIVLLFDIEVLYIYPLVISILSLSYGCIFVNKLIYTSIALLFPLVSFLILFFLGEHLYYRILPSVVNSFLILPCLKFPSLTLSFISCTIFKVLLFIRNSIPLKEAGYANYSLISIRSVASLAVSRLKNLQYSFLKKLLVNHQIINTILSFSFFCVFVYLINITNTNSDICVITIGLISNKNLLSHIVKYPHIIKRFSPGKNVAKKVVQAGEDLGKDLAKKGAQTPSNQVPSEGTLPKPIYDTKDYGHKPTPMQKPVKPAPNPVVELQKISSTPPIEASDEENKENQTSLLISLEKGNHDLDNTLKNNNKEADEKMKKIISDEYKQFIVLSKKLYPPEPSLTSLYENSINSPNTTSSSSGDFQYPQNDQEFMDRIFKSSSQHPFEKNAKNNNSINQFNIPSFSQINKNTQAEECTLPQLLYEAYVRGILKADNKIQKDTNFIDENNNEIKAPAQKIPVKLTGHGQECIKNGSIQEKGFPIDLIEDNIQIRLAIIDPTQIANNNDALYESLQTHVVMTADNGATYYIIGILTSSKKVGDLFTNIQIKDFQHQKEGNIINAGKTPKPQNIIIRPRLEVVDKKLVTCLKHDLEYLKKDEDIENRVIEIKAKILQKEATYYESSEGVDKEKLLTAIITHDKAVNLKTKFSKLESSNDESEVTKNEKLDQTAIKDTQQKKNDE